MGPDVGCDPIARLEGVSHAYAEEIAGRSRRLTQLQLKSATGGGLL